MTHTDTAAALLAGFRRTESLLHNADCVGLDREDGRYRLLLCPETAALPHPVISIAFRAKTEETRDDYSPYGRCTDCTAVDIDSVRDETTGLPLPLEGNDRIWMAREILGYWGSDIVNL